LSDKELVPVHIQEVMTAEEEAREYWTGINDKLVAIQAQYDKDVATMEGKYFLNYVSANSRYFHANSPYLYDGRTPTEEEPKETMPTPDEERGAGGTEAPGGGGGENAAGEGGEERHVEAIGRGRCPPKARPPRLISRPGLRAGQCRARPAESTARPSLRRGFETHGGFTHMWFK